MDFNFYSIVLLIAIILLILALTGVGLIMSGANTSGLGNKCPNNGSSNPDGSSNCNSY
jgi:hypothetical protein